MIKPRKHVQELDLITIVNRTYCFSLTEQILVSRHLNLRYKMCVPNTTFNNCIDLLKILIDFIVNVLLFTKYLYIAHTFSELKRHNTRN